MAKWAGVVLGEHRLRTVYDLDGDIAATEFQRRFQRVNQPDTRRVDVFGRVVADDESVDDDLNRVLLRLCQLVLFVQFTQLAVDANADEAGLADLFEDTCVFAFAVADDGAEDQDSRAVFKAEDQFGHLLWRL